MQVMDENYRLVFRGEVLDNQHPAVVKKRLISVLKISEEQAERLFSGSSIVVKHSADTKTAARYQGLFKQAGARLRVLPVAEAPNSRSSAAQDTQASQSSADASNRDESQQEVASETDVSHIKLQGAQYSHADAEPSEILAPDFSLANVGVNLVEPRPVETYETQADFELAEVGALIPTLAKDIVVTVNMDELEFEVAEVGADIGDPAPETLAVAPDISHLSLVD